MVREQQHLVLRDFLGTGNDSAESTRKEAPSHLDMKEQLGTWDFWEVSSMKKGSDNKALVQAGCYGSRSRDMPAQAHANHTYSFLSEFGETMPKAMVVFPPSDTKDQVFPLGARQASVPSGSSSQNRSMGQACVPGSFVNSPHCMLSCDHAVMYYQSVGMINICSGMFFWLSRILSSNFCNNQNSSQLTILYGGRINVYNGISAKKAHAIMNLAANGTSWQTNVLNASSGQYGPFGGSMTPQSVPAALRAGGLNKEEMMELNINHTNLDPTNTQVADEQGGKTSPPAYASHELLSPNILSKPSSSRSPEESVFPKALPQARKASLARFLEKRKERVQCKSPYFIKQPCPEQSVLLEERLSSSNSPMPYDECAKKKTLPLMGGMGNSTVGIKANFSFDTHGKEESGIGT